MKDANPTTHWEIIRDDSANTWTWRRVRVDGTIENVSAWHYDFGGAVTDALKHGFRPKDQHWLVKDRNFTTHFHPGNAPVTVTRNDEVIQGSAAASRESKEQDESGHSSGR